LKSRGYFLFDTETNLPGEVASQFASVANACDIDTSGCGFAQALYVTPSCVLPTLSPAIPKSNQQASGRPVSAADRVRLQAAAMEDGAVTEAVFAD
jgi:hypothetical protein